MTFVIAIALLTLVGLVIRRVPSVAEMELPAQLAISFAAGMMITGTLMFAFSLAGISWTRVSLGMALAACAALGVWKRAAGKGKGWIGIALFVLLTLYGVMTARETCADLMYFWGPKGEKFYRAEKIDVEMLKFPHYFLMHPDYPPLLPEIYAWGSLVGHRFSQWGALALTPLFLLATVLAFRGIAARKIGEELAGHYAVLMAAVLAYGFAAGMVAGAGDPPLLLFEVIALAALTFEDDWRLAALGIAGAMFLKVEGTAFAAVLLACSVVTRRRVLPAIKAAAPGIILLGAWIAFARHHGFLDAYGKSKSALHLHLLGKVTSLTARQASYGAFYLPWLAALAPLSSGRNWRRALLPLLAGIGVIVYTLYFYLHDADPAWWIASSAERVLLTALACFVVATAAASE
ncbi:MAG TPA: hypothetical protein VJ276_08730 [Thermoanaerobaculia bacterium]|nr:hypothetical protein [Thermoanaerobaculia bacterium]